jgi:hypothetical protein
MKRIVIALAAVVGWATLGQGSSQGSESNRACPIGNCGRIDWARVAVSPPLQWAVPCQPMPPSSTGWSRSYRPIVPPVYSPALPQPKAGGWSPPYASRAADVWPIVPPVYSPALPPIRK